MKTAPLLLLGLALLLPLHAAEKAPAAPTPPPAIDPAALAPLQRMSDTLAAAKAFTFRSRNLLEVPAVTGQFVTLVSTGEVTVRRPNKISARLAGEAPAFDFFYDGETVAAYAPATSVYSLAKAPATIDEMLSGLQTETGIRFATAPLLRSNPYAALTRDLTSALVVGPTRIDGIACNHLAFRSPGVNWEIWLEANARSLPRRIAVTFTDRPNFPRTLVEFTAWNLHPWISNATFTFTPPAGAREIPFKAVMESTGR